MCVYFVLLDAAVTNHSHICMIYVCCLFQPVVRPTLGHLSVYPTHAQRSFRPLS